MSANTVLVLSQLSAPNGVAHALQLLRERHGQSKDVIVDAVDAVDCTVEALEFLVSISIAGSCVIFSGAKGELIAHLTDLGFSAYLKYSSDLMADQAKESSKEYASSQEQSELRTMKKRILTIDDSKTMRDMLLLTLDEAGFEVLQAVDGEDAMDVLSREYVDLIITDINMPRMDGYEVIRKVRANPAFERTPILVLTTEGETDKRAIAKEAGATGWMVKPFDPERLVETVSKVAA